ncbi:MAG: amidohydrolase family protein [Saprospiraceae bacterium]
MNIRYSLTLYLFCATVVSLCAQVIPTPAPAQKEAILIMGATAHIGDGRVIDNSALAFENGKLTLVADATTIRIDRSKYGRIYDASGKHVYPGLIAPDTRLGLVEIEAAKPTLDFSEPGAYNPNARSIVAYNTDSHVIPTVRSNGILMAQICPIGGIMSGTSSVVQLDAWNWEDAAYKIDEGIHLNWPAERRGGQRRGMGGREEEDPYEKNVQELHRYFEEARAYAQQAAPEVQNPRFESMRGLFDKRQTLYIHTDRASGIQESVLFAEKFGLRAVLVGARDVWLTADFLKTHNVPVILGRTNRLPGREDEDIDQAFKTPALLHSKGVTFSFSDVGAWQQRNLAFEAGQAVAYGLPKEAAVQALTLDAARILGIDTRCGSLETGKDATLFISEGDVLDMRSCQVTAAFIQGREINLDNKHKQLRKRFEEKYRQ